MKVNETPWKILDKDDYPDIEMYKKYQAKYSCFRVYLNFENPEAKERIWDKIGQIEDKYGDISLSTNIEINRAQNYYADGGSITFTRGFRPYHKVLACMYTCPRQEFYQSERFKKLAKVLYDEGYKMEEEGEFDEIFPGPYDD
jgi:hypothetical protein